MCIIISKPRGLDLPKEAKLEQAFKANDDGFGLAYIHEGEKMVHIRKGAMTIEATMELIEAVPNLREADVLLHFRTATEGKVCAGNCHPYPISTKTHFLKHLTVRTPIAIAHNGIVSVSEDGQGKRIVQVSLLQHELTDTQKFVKYFLAGMGMTIFNKRVTKLMRIYVGGKFAFLTPQGFHFVGEFTEEDGLYYSTTIPEPFVYNRSGFLPPMFRWDYCQLCCDFHQIMRVMDDVWACENCCKELDIPTYAFASSGYNYYGNEQGGFY